jgi:DUF1365 family protein
MPGMTPMEFTSPAAPKGDKYSFTANIPMEGGWKVDVTATRQDKPEVTATFNVDARQDRYPCLSKEFSHDELG